MFRERLELLGLPLAKGERATLSLPVCKIYPRDSFRLRSDGVYREGYEGAQPLHPICPRLSWSRQ